VPERSSLKHQRYDTSRFRGKEDTSGGWGESGEGRHTTLLGKEERDDFGIHEAGTMLIDLTYRLSPKRRRRPPKVAQRRELHILDDL
jgi:hypothetical protein